MITTCDWCREYKVRQSWITNCDKFWITKCHKNFKKLITECDGITNRDRLQSDTVHGVQSTKVIYCNRFSFLLSIYNVNIFNERINILEYPEFVIDLDL